MALIQPELKIERETVPFRIPKELAARVSLYAQFLDSGRDYVVTQILHYVVDLDREFAAWLQEHAADGAREVSSADVLKRRAGRPLILTVIQAQETSTPRWREKIDWKLITNLPMRSRKEAVEKLAWYAMRWKIETFHKILKSGCRAEASKLRAAERIVNLIAVFCILSWRIFWMTMMNRAAPTASP
jgi:hypothetical protein